LVYIRRPLFSFNGEGYSVRIEVMGSYIEGLVLPGAIRDAMGLIPPVCRQAPSGPPLSDWVYRRYSSLAKDLPSDSVS